MSAVTSSANRHPTTYGERAKIGVIVPPTNTVNEAEWHEMAPAGVTIHSTRMPLHEDTTSEEGVRALYRDVQQATEYLAAANLDAIAYGCTAGSMVHPMSELSDFMTETSGVSCVTTAASLVAALSVLGAKSIAIATPYHEALNAHEAEFFSAAGFNISNISGLGIGESGPEDYVRIAKTDAGKIYDHVMGADRDDADAMMISCTDFPVLRMIPELERQLGKPVVTSNQATFWAVLRAARIDDRFDDFGKLLSTY